MKQHLKDHLYEVIFEADTRSGKAFDIVLLIAILLSTVTVLLESVPSIEKDHAQLLNIIEWGITVIFSIEYVTRIWVTRKPMRYILSFYGIIDFASVIPAYLGLFLVGYQSLMVIRALRLLRIFRILKLTRYTNEAKNIWSALYSSRIKIFVFLMAVLTLVLIIGAMMYIIEGQSNGFESIPKSIYWAIVTLTTVGYGDIAPQTPLGQFLSSLVMILGYAIIAVPTGIVSVEFASKKETTLNTQVCSNCMKEGHDNDAEFCKYCGSRINDV